MAALFALWRFKLPILIAGAALLLGVLWLRIQYLEHARDNAARQLEAHKIMLAAQVRAVSELQEDHRNVTALSAQLQSDLDSLASATASTCSSPVVDGLLERLRHRSDGSQD